VGEIPTRYCCRSLKGGNLISHCSENGEVPFGSALTEREKVCVYLVSASIGTLHTELTESDAGALSAT